ncbi:hypothetical protein EJB05_03633, partial [Eragrostis curvula]
MKPRPKRGRSLEEVKTGGPLVKHLSYKRPNKYSIGLVLWSIRPLASRPPFPCFEANLISLFLSVSPMSPPRRGDCGRRTSRELQCACRCLVSCLRPHMTALAFCEGTAKSPGWLECSRSRPVAAIRAWKGAVACRRQKPGTFCLRASPSFSRDYR